MNRPVAWGVAALCFAVHVLCMAPGLSWYDGGELSLAAGGMGVAHPPGEPAWTVVASLVALVPIGSLPLRLALLAAATVAGAAGLLTHLAVRLGQRWTGETHALAGIVTGLCFGLGPAAMHQATRVELYGMMALLGALAAVLLERGGRRGVALAVLPLAVAGAVHHAMLVAAIPGLVVFALGRGRGSLQAGAVTAALFVVPALGQFLWLPLRSMTDPTLDFGHPNSPERVLWSVLARGYARSFRPAEGQIADNLGAHLGMLRLDLGDLGLLVGGLALGLALLRQRRDGIAALLILVVGVLPTVLQGVFRPDNPDARGYLLAPWAVACLGAGLGALWISIQLRAKTSLARLVAPVLALVLVSTPARMGLETSDRSGLQAPDRLGAAALDEAPPGSLVLLAGDSWAFPPLYARYFERRRPDLTVVPLHMFEPLTVAQLRRRGAPLPALSDAAIARVDAGHRGLVGENTLAEVLRAGAPPLVVNDVALPPELLAARRPLGLLYALGGAGDPEAEERLWTRVVDPLRRTGGFARDTVGQDALSRRYASRAGWFRSRGAGEAAQLALTRASTLASDPWDTAHLWRHRFEQGDDPVGPRPQLDAQAAEALAILFAGDPDAAGARVRSLLQQAPAHPWGLLAAERLYSLGVAASPSLAGPTAPP